MPAFESYLPLLMPPPFTILLSTVRWIYYVEAAGPQI